MVDAILNITLSIVITCMFVNSIYRLINSLSSKKYVIDLISRDDVILEYIYEKDISVRNNFRERDFSFFVNNITRLINTIDDDKLLASTKKNVINKGIMQKTADGRSRYLQELISSALDKAQEEYERFQGLETDVSQYNLLTVIREYLEVPVNCEEQHNDNCQDDILSQCYCFV